MSFLSNPLLEAHGQDAQRLWEKQRLTRQDMDVWEMNLKVYDPTRPGLTIRPPAFIVRLQEYFAGFRANLSHRLVRACRSVERAGSSPRFSLLKATLLFMGASFVP